MVLPKYSGCDIVIPLSTVWHAWEPANGPAPSTKEPTSGDKLLLLSAPALCETTSKRGRAKSYLGLRGRSASAADGDQEQHDPQILIRSLEINTDVRLWPMTILAFAKKNNSPTSSRSHWLQTGLWIIDVVHWKLEAAEGRALQVSEANCKLRRPISRRSRSRNMKKHLKFRWETSFFL